MSHNVIQSARIETRPERLFEMYLDSRVHTAFTGQKATIEPRAGGLFRAFDGMLCGTILLIESRCRIVQTWRSTNWPADAPDSVLVLSFCPAAQGARVDVVHIGIPGEDLAGVTEGWEKYYWTPLRAYLVEQES